jgi:hypothetical protein
MPSIATLSRPTSPPSFGDPAPVMPLAALRSCRAELASLVDRMDASVLSGFDAAAAVEVACEIERLAGGLKLLASARVLETRSWADRGASSAPRWLAQTARSTVGDAARTLQTAEQLSSLPATRERVRQGRLSSAQAREVADAATADPTTEAALLGVAAKSSVAELKDRCRRAKAAAAPDSADERYAKIRRERRLGSWTDSEGGFNLSGRSTVDDGALLKSILDPIADRLFRDAHQAGRCEPAAAYRWDALVEVFRLAGMVESEVDLDDLVDASRDADDTEDGGDDDRVADSSERLMGDAVSDDLFDGHRCTTEPAPSRALAPLPALATGRGRTRDRPPGPQGVADRTAARRPKRRSRSATVGSRTKIIVRVDHAALVRGWVEGDETCDIAGVGPIPVRIARQFLGDAFLALLVTKGIDVHTVAHAGRRANVFQNTALEWTNAACTTEGCPNTALLETDHTEEWHRTHHTTLTELGRLCKDCHAKRTRKGYRLRASQPAHGQTPAHPSNLPVRPRVATSLAHPAPASPYDL